MYSDALALAQLYATGKADPVEIVESTFERADKSPATFISMSRDRSRREALASRARWQAGEPLSPLDGVPVAWKDLFDMSGCITTAGAKVRKHAAAASEDAVLVAILSRAGMVNVGKTNLSEFAYSGLGLNPHFGTPLQGAEPGNERAPGGSSSGSAIAVAADIVPIAMGTDTAGSIRVPAAFNGLVGYRSSRLRYPSDGVYPLARSLDSLGPLAKSVRDVICIDNLLVGSSAGSLRSPLPLRGIRLRVDSQLLANLQLEPAVRTNLADSLLRLERAGAVIEDRPVVAFAKAMELIETVGWPGSAEAFCLHQALLDSPDAEQLDPRVRRRLEAARDFPAFKQIRLYQASERLRAELAAELDGALLITPTVAHVAPLMAALLLDDDLFAKTNLATLRLTMPGSLLDMPGVALPNGADATGLPTSLLVSAPSGQDEYLLRAALAIELLVRAA